MKKLISLISLVMAFIMLLFFEPVDINAAAGVYKTEMNSVTSFSMPSFFNNGMLFQQQKDMNLWGKAAKNAKVTVELYKEKQSAAEQTVIADADSNGEWQVSLSPKKGGYESYIIEVFEDGVLKKMITDVVIGELWLATGQSNMEFALSRAVGGAEMIKSANDKYIRILLEPSDPYGVNNDHPSVPDYDVAGSRWGYGNESSDLGNVSAMAYIAVLEMRKQLDVPVGFINAAIGATTIQAWMSRESIEENAFVYEALAEKNIYISPENFLSGIQPWTAMTACYNTKIGPLAGINLAGVFWCQGESNCDGLPNKTGYYSAALEALMKGYSRDFGFENDDIPFLVADIAPHNYNGDYSYIGYWIEEISSVCAKYENISQYPLYDATLVYKDPPATDFWPIHPSDKTLIGKRLGQAALHNIYNKGNTDYYAPEIESLQINGNKITVKFKNVADGLDIIGGGKDVHGFAVCGSDRKFTAAKAKIISKDTVEVWNDGVESPVALTYAFASFNCSASLCNSYGLPAVAYRSDNVKSTYLAPCDWITCDNEEVWVSDSTNAGFKPAWSTATVNGTENLSIEIDRFIKAEGTGSLKISYASDSQSGFLAGAGPVLNYYLMPSNLAQYNYISVLVRNEDDRQKQLSLLIKTNNGVKWKVASAKNSGNYTYDIPAKSGFTRYVFDLSDIKAYDSDETASASVIKRSTSGLQFTVSDSQNGTIYIDDVEFGFVNPGELEYPYVFWYGDINRNGEVSASDALRVLQHSVNKIALEGDDITAADVDKNGKVTASDALLILQRSVNKISSFPAEG